MPDGTSNPILSVGETATSANAAATSCNADLLVGLTRVTELGHSDADQHGAVVAELAHRLALKAGFAANFREKLRFAARLHDVGKIAIPREILMKPAGLTAAERCIVEMHAQIGATIIRGYRLPDGPMAEEVALHHHERWDGTGYPCRVPGRAIPVSARLVAIADVFDALLARRCYKQAWPPSDTRDHLAEQRGRAFDPSLLDLFLADFDRMIDLREEILAGSAPVATAETPPIPVAAA